MGGDVKIFFSLSCSCSHFHYFAFLRLAFFLVDFGGRRSVNGLATLEKILHETCVVSLESYEGTQFVRVRGSRPVSDLLSLV